MAFKMKNPSIAKLAKTAGSPMLAKSPMLKEPVVTKTRTLERRIMHPGGAVFEGSETSPRIQRLEGGGGYTHYPASSDDPTESSVTRGRRTTTVTKHSDGDITKTKVKRRRSGSVRKRVRFETSGDKTVKITTYYNRDGSVRRTKRKVVKTTKKRTSHRKKDQKLVDATKVTYVAGGSRDTYGRR
jgi:hypothetical protein